MMKEQILKSVSINENKIIHKDKHTDAGNPLPGRTPSKAFLAALDAVGRMWENGKKPD